MTPRDVLEWLRTHATDRRAWMASYASPFYEDVEAANNDRADCIEALIAQTEWRPIATAPFNEDILVFAPDSTDAMLICHRCLFVGQSEKDWDGDWYEQNVDACPSPLDVALTHWLPLPSPPPNGDPVGLRASAHGRTEPDSNAGLAAGSPPLPAGEQNE